MACHNPSYILKGFPMVRDVKPGGVFLINCQWSDEELDKHMPAVAKRYIAENDIQSTPSTRSTWQPRSAWASAPTPFSSPLSSPWPT